jgi:hypothetical protein
MEGCERKGSARRREIISPDVDIETVLLNMV